MLYLDNAATTPLLPEVRKMMMNYGGYLWQSIFYMQNRQNEQSEIAVEEARKSIAETIGACADDIFYIQAGLKVCWVLESAWEINSRIRPSALYYCKCYRTSSCY